MLADARILDVGRCLERQNQRGPLRRHTGERRGPDQVNGSLLGLLTDRAQGARRLKQRGIRGLDRGIPAGEMLENRDARGHDHPS